MYTISPLSGSSSGLEYPEVNTVVLLFARVTVSEFVVWGVPVAPDVEPVIKFAPLKATYPPVAVSYTHLTLPTILLV